MANKTIQLLRNTSILADLNAAKVALKNSITTAKDGELALARYNATEDGTTVVKTLVGVYHVTGSTQSITYLINEDEFNTFIESLNASVSAGTEYAQVSVSQNEGKLSGMTIDLNYGGFDSTSGIATVGIAKIEDVVNIANYAANSLYIEQEDGSGTVKETYKLLNAEGNQLGDTITINVDQAFKTAKLVESGETYHDVTYSADTLVLTYVNASGETIDAGVPVDSFLTEQEFKDGLEVKNGQVYVKIDTASTDNYLTVSEDGLNLSGIGEDITKNIITSITFNEVDGIFTSGTSGNSVTIDATSSDINIGDNFQTTEYPYGLSAATPIESGITISSAFTCVENTISALTQEVINDELVTAQALDAIANAAGILSADTIMYVTEPTAKYISAATSLADADFLLNNAIETMASGTLNKINAGDGIWVSALTDGKQTISAVTKSADPIIEVTSDGIGTKDDAVFDCGTYTV